MKTTFVTAFFKLDENSSAGVDRKFETNLEHFRNLVRSGIQLHVFTNRAIYDQVRSVGDFPIDLLEVSELECYRSEAELPFKRTSGHDTREFMIVQNSKISLVRSVMKSGRYDTPNYAWIDFSIFHVISDTDRAIRYLSDLGSNDLNTDKVILPGCWPKGDYLIDFVSWRFCGGFFIGPAAAIEEMYQLHQKIFKSLPKLTWEVNVWSLMESRLGWDCQWFLADHNDTIIKIPEILLKK